MVLKIHNIAFRTQVWHHYPDISLYLHLYREFKFEVHFILGLLVLQKPESHNIICMTQVWHHYPDISLYLNLYRESKFEVFFPLFISIYEIAIEIFLVPDLECIYKRLFLYMRTKLSTKNILH